MQVPIGTAGWYLCECEDEPAFDGVELSARDALVAQWLNQFQQGASPLGGWAWQGAQPLALLEGDVRSAAMEYLGSLHGMAASGQFDGFVEASAIKIEEYARAYGIAAAPFRDSIRRALTSETAGLRLRPLVPHGIDLRLVGGGRMVRCLRTDRHHALEYAGEPGGPTFFLPAMIGATASGWRLLR